MSSESPHACQEGLTQFAELLCLAVDIHNDTLLSKTMSDADGSDTGP
jgi:hypothetical protein